MKKNDFELINEKILKELEKLKKSNEYLKKMQKQLKEKQTEIFLMLFDYLINDKEMFNKFYNKAKEDIEFKEKMRLFIYDELAIKEEKEYKSE